MANAVDGFKGTVESLFSGLDGFISSKTVIGEAITFGDTVILPLVDVSFGLGAGQFSGDNKNNGAGGMGAKLQPSAILVVNNGKIKLVNVKNQDSITKILDMVPDLVDKITATVASKKAETNEAAKEEAATVLAEELGLE